MNSYTLFKVSPPGYSYFVIYIYAISVIYVWSATLSEPSGQLTFSPYMNIFCVFNRVRTVHGVYVYYCWFRSSSRRQPNKLSQVMMIASSHSFCVLYATFVFAKLVQYALGWL